MSRRGAFTLTEVLVAVFLVVFGLFTIITVYSNSLRHGTQSRARILASVLCESLMAEIADHPYGTPAPARWGDAKTGKPYVVVVPTVVQGRAVQTSFEVLVKTDRRGGNGSFFDPTVMQATDHLVVTVRWAEGTDAAGAQAQKVMTMDLPVRREPNLAIRK